MFALRKAARGQPEDAGGVANGASRDNVEAFGEKVSAESLTYNVIDFDALSLMLESMPINVMMAEPENFTITYINKRSVDTLKTIQQYLPEGVRADNLIGQCIDVFHKRPEAIRSILADPSNLPWQARIQVGPETLNLRVNAVLNKAGDYIGPMVTWSAVTEIDAFANGVKEAVEKVAKSAQSMQSGAQSMNTSAEQTTHEAATAAAGAEEASANAQTVASAADEMSTSISEIARQVSH